MNFSAPLKKNSFISFKNVDIVMEADSDKKCTAENAIHSNRIEGIMKRQGERRKAEKNGVTASNLSEVEKFTDTFNKKQKEIENELESLRSTNLSDHENLSNRLNMINGEIQELQRLYSNSTLFLRIYDKKIFQESLQAIQSKFQNIENELMPKKKFGFKLKKNKVERAELKFSTSEVDSPSKSSDLPSKNFVGITGKSNEELTLEGEDIKKRDIVLKDLKNCSVWLKGVPTTVHATNIRCCKLFFGPVATSVFLENVNDSIVHLACQQLRIHDTAHTDFYIHVTSKAIIENCKHLRFGIYKLDYEGINEDYEISNLNRLINNWDKVDDFNWLIMNKPSPNWSVITNDLNKN